MQKPDRLYGEGYFREVEGHWHRMVAGAPDRAMQFDDCLAEGAACIRIAGYSIDRFRATFTDIAAANGLVSKLGGDDALKARLSDTIDRLVTNFAETMRQVRAEFRLIVNNEIKRPPNLFNQLDDLLNANDADRLRAFLDEQNPADARRALSYLDRKINERANY
jgi:hypothetical protein